MTVTHLWVGAVSPTSAWVRGKVTGSSVRLAVDTDPALGAPTYFGPASPTAEDIASIEATGLDPDTQYYFAFEDDAVLDTDWSGSFRTHPTLGEPASYAFASASCAGHVNGGFTTSEVSNHPVFDTIRAHRYAPLFMAHTGDLHYRNIATNTPASFRTAYDDVLTFNGTQGAAALQGLLYRNVPIVYAWDDHDFGANDSDGTSASAPAAQSVYRERVPYYTLPSASAIYQSFGVGRVLYVLADVRSARSPNSDPDGPSKTMLGAAQKTWLEGVLTAPGFDAQFLVWLMSSQWMGLGTDTWASFATERDEIVEMLGDTDWLTRMCIVSGDLHSLAIDTGTGNTWGGFPVYQFAALDGDGGAIQTHYSLGPTRPGRNQYGTVQVVDDGDSLTTIATAWVGAEPWRRHVYPRAVSRIPAPRWRLRV